MPYNKEEWVTGGTPVVARMLQARLFEGDTEFPVGTTVAYEHTRFMVGTVTVIARFNGETWDITRDQEPHSTPYFLDMLRGPFVDKIWLLDDGATIYQKDQKEGF